MDRYVDAFLLHRESEGRTSTTLASHQSNLKAFIVWATDNYPDVQLWTPTTLRTYFVYLRDRGSKHDQKLKPSSVRCYASSVLAFCRWLYAEEFISKNIADRVPAPKIPTLVKEPFEVADVKKMLHVAKADSRNGVRDYALLLFMLDTGARASEVVSLKSSEILWSQRMAKVFGKGGKERVLFFSIDTMKAMQRYNIVDPGNGELFFRTEESKALTGSGLLQIVKRIGRRAKVLNVHPHRFRHTFAITFLRSGGNVLALQRLLGHTTLTMTQRYVALVSDDLAKQHVAHSPVASMLGR